MTDPRTTRVRRRIVAGAAALGAAAMLGALVPVPVEAATSPTPRKIVTGWGYFSSTSSSALTSLQDNVDLFSDVSPFWYSAKWTSASGSSIAPSYSASTRASVLASIKATGVPVLPTITDGTGKHRMATLLSGTTTRTTLVNQIVATVLKEGYDGIDLDFEGFAFSDGSSTWAATRPNWVAFVKQLSAGLHAKGRLLSITTPPLYTPTTGYWVYDWKSIGGYVDRLRVMTYDYSVSKAGPISPFPWVSKVAAFAVTQVPSGKIQIGVPNYGRDWVTGVAYSGVTAKCPTNAPAGSNPTQVSTFASALSYATQRHVISSSDAAGYLAKWSGSSFTAPGIRLLTKPVALWNPTYKERTFTTKVSFTGTRYQSVSTTGTAARLATVVAVPSTAGIVAGLTATGAGIPAATRVVAVNATTKLVTLSQGTTAALASTAVRFAGPAPAVCTVNRLAYYDDATAAAARATLVNTYHLRGITQWTIGGEDSAQWSKLRSYASTIAPDTTVVRVSAPTVVTYGGRTSVGAVATSSGLPVASSAYLYFRKAGNRSWTMLTKSATNANGRVVFTPTVTASGTYLVNVSGSFDRLAGNGQKAVVVRSGVAVTAPSSPVTALSRVSIAAHFTPVHLGQASVLQLRTSKGWVTVASTRADKLGRVSYGVRAPGRHGTAGYRLLAAAYPNVGGHYAYLTITSA
jgi:spore germination protein YaaH